MSRLRLVLIFLLIGLTSQLSAQKPASGKTYKLFFEKVYLHTDREQYVSGEDIWFKAYLINAQTNMLISSSNNLYVELISPSSDIIERKVIRLDKGLGKGDFKPGDSIAGGTYRLRAYTNYMRNFGDTFIFEKNITVSPVSGPGNISSNGDSEKEKKADASQSKSTSPAVPAQIIKFFPEGGSLIEGVTSVIAFKAEGSSGKGIAVNGSVVSSNGETTGTFSSTDAGMGSFTLTPLAGVKYSVKGTYGSGQIFSAELPVALHKGLSMHIMNNSDSLISIIFSTNPATLSDLENKELQIIGKSHGKSYYTAAIILKDLQGTVNIPKNVFPSGIASITLYDNQGRPQCERLTYIDSREQVNIKLTTDKTSYSPKEKVTLTINATDQDGRPAKTYLSVSAFDNNIVTGNRQSILSYLMLQSEVKGSIDNPSQYFTPENPARFKQLDLLLMTQGWRDFIWKKLADSAINLTYELEQGITVSGRLRQVWADQPVTGANITLSAFKAKGAKLFSAKTDSAGRFYIDTVQLYGRQPISLTATNSKGKNTGWIQMNPLFRQPPAVSPLPPADIQQVDPFSEQLAERRRSQIKQRMTDTIELKEVVIKDKHVRLFDGVLTDFGYPTESFDITSKDYDYRNLAHFILHRVSTARPGDSDIVTFISTSGKTKPSVRFIANGREVPFTDDDPQEMRSHYYNQYYNIRMDKIEKVVIRHMLSSPGLQQGGEESENAMGVGTVSMSQLSGPRDFYVIYLTLKPDALAPDVPSKYKEDITGYYEARTFYSPYYGTTANKTDLRTTIYWNPNIVTNEQGKATLTFYNADPKTKISIDAEGISDTGIPVKATTIYEVK